MEKKNTYYLVGNAHLDPVWQWRWQEGSMEAKATIRSALDRMKEFPKFRFVCSSASVYQWVEEFAPDMLEEVKERVREGRFIIVGGWHVQPDCNLPSGEAFARQSLYAQRYFKETFGVTAKVGYNVDSFGHNAMMPQILKKSGMDSYIFMRPSPSEKPMEHDIFRWVSDDGSSVTACRIPEYYCLNFTSVRQVEDHIRFLDADQKPGLPVRPVFYGVGNHGGGPTIQNLQLLEEFARLHPEKELVYSDLLDFFGAISENGAAEYHGDLQHHASGCYSAVPEIKQQIRRAEAALSAAESYSILAAALCGKVPKTKVFEEAWKQVCFCHFHDCMDGCSIKAVYEDAADMLGMAKHMAAVEENNALQSISWRIRTNNPNQGQPIVVFNPHGFDAEYPVRVNQQFAQITDHTGAEIPCQQVHSATSACRQLKDTLFKASVPALGYAVYYAKGKESQSSAGAVQATPWTGPLTANEHGGPVLENELLRIQFEPYSGYITAFTDKRTGREWITGRAAVPVVIDEYYHDTWSHAKNFFTDQMARFSDAQVTVTETGPVRATMKVVSRYNDSTLTQYFSLTAGSDKLQVQARVDWHEKHKLLKLAWPMAVEDPSAYYEIPYGIIQRPADGEEEPGINWTAVKGSNGGFAIVNNGTYSSSVKGGTIYQTVLRSPIYADHGGPRTEENDFTAQGIFKFSYTLMPVGEDWTDVVREGKLLNKGLTNIIDTWHDGCFSDVPYAGICIDCPHVMLSAIKRSEDGTGTVVRIYEVTGKEGDFTVSGDTLPCPLSGHITPWSVQTYYCRDGSDTWQEVLLTEYPIV